MSNFTKCLHFSNDEVPKMIEFMEAKGIEYSVRKLSYPSNRKLCNSIHMKFEERELNDEIYAFIRKELRA